MTIKVILKNGIDFSFKCKKLKTSASSNTGDLLSWEAIDIEEQGKPLYIRLDEIAAIIQEEGK